MTCADIPCKAHTAAMERCVSALMRPTLDRPKRHRPVDPARSARRSDKAALLRRRFALGL